MPYNRTAVFTQLATDANNSFSVGDDYRTNPLSRLEGGCVVKVKYTNGSIRIYDKIKNAQAYIRYITNYSTDDIEEISVVD